MADSIRKKTVSRRSRRPFLELDMVMVLCTLLIGVLLTALIWSSGAGRA